MIDTALQRLNNVNTQSAERKEFEESDESPLRRHNGVLRHPAELLWADPGFPNRV